MTAQTQTARLGDEKVTTAHSSWSSLYKAAAAAALLSVLVIPIQIVVFMIAPMPETIAGWFALLQSHLWIGLVDLDLLLLVDEVLALFIFLALFAALHRLNESMATIGLMLGLVSVVLFIVSNPAIAMLQLNGQYAAASTEAQKAAALSAGQAIMASWEGSAFQVGYIIGSIAPILLCAVMLQSGLFSKTTAYLGILANVIALGLYVPVIGIYISVFSVVFLWVWYLLVARRFFQLSRETEE